MTIRIGTAGWTIPKDEASRFPAEGTSLQRYSARLGVAEINSSFHRPHRASTWERWRESVPATFRFSAKLPKTITHERKLKGCEDLLDPFLAEVSLLEDHFAILLIQLPPKLAFDEAVLRDFAATLRERTQVAIVIEPRNASWFTAEVDALLAEEEISRAGADPAIVPEAAAPSGWRKLAYVRLHGSPQTYRSSYGDRLDQIAAMLRQAAVQAEDCWCIFDNTASSAAMSDALKLKALLDD